MAGPNADPVAGVTYASSRGAREKTGLNAVNDFTKNATGDYAQMLADKAAQTEANALPLGGSGIGKLNEAIENSPQLQSGLMAAGLSLMFGGDAESAITTGLGAASNYNQQVVAEEDKKKAEMLAGAKQQSQMEHSYEQGNLMQRQPDSFNVDAARISAGVAGKQLNADAYKVMTGNAIRRMELAATQGMPLSFSEAIAQEMGQGGALARDVGVVLPGAPGLDKGTGRNKSKRLSLDQAASLKAYVQLARASGLPKEEQDSMILSYAAGKAGAGDMFSTAADVESTLVRMLGTDGKPEPAAPGKLAPPPALGEKPQPPTKPATPAGKGPGAEWVGKDLNKVDIPTLQRLAYAATDNPDWQGPSLQHINAMIQKKQTSAKKLYEALPKAADGSLDSYLSTFK